MTEENDCHACIAAVARVETGMAKIDTRLEIFNGSIMKIVYALLGVIGANIGTKFIGTPWEVELTMYAYMFGAIFVLLLTIAKFRCLSFWEVEVRLAFVSVACWVSYLRIYHYQTDTPFTMREGIITQLLSLSMAVGFIMIAWRRDALRKKRKRRWDDKQVILKEAEMT